MSSQDRATAEALRPTAKVVSALQFPGELVRKSLHLLIALVPLLASYDLSLALSLLAAGTIFYTLAEASRRSGHPVLVVSDLTLIASRERDRGRFVLGPITLSLGAMLSLILYPEPAASVAIYALAFGDGIASIAGKLVGGPRLPLLRGKTVSGSFACLLMVFLATLRITGKPVESAVIAGAATVLEAFPTGDFDNLVLPLGAGLLATQLLR
jgi:dolichol kinase